MHCVFPLSGNIGLSDLIGISYGTINYFQQCFGTSRHDVGRQTVTTVFHTINLGARIK